MSDKDDEGLKIAKIEGSLFAVGCPVNCQTPAHSTHYQKGRIPMRRPSEII